MLSFSHRSRLTNIDGKNNKRKSCLGCNPWQRCVYKLNRLFPKVSIRKAWLVRVNPNHSLCVINIPLMWFMLTNAYTALLSAKKVSLKAFTSSFFFFIVNSKLEPLSTWVNARKENKDWKLELLSGSIRVLCLGCYDLLWRLWFPWLISADFKLCFDTKNKSKRKGNYVFEATIEVQTPLRITRCRLRQWGAREIGRGDFYRTT